MKKITLFLLFIALLTACTTEIGPINTHEPKKLIINAILNAGKAENAIYLNLTDRSQPEIVENGIIRLYINGELSETIDKCITRPLEDNEIPSYNNSYYPVHSRFHSGDHVRIEVETKDNNFRAEAETTVYEQLKITGLDTLHIKANGFYWKYQAIRLKVGLETPASDSKQTKYYRVLLNEKYTYHLTNIETKQDSIFDLTNWSGMQHYYDTALMDGKPGNINNSDLNIDILPSQENNYRVFSDTYFTNRQYTMTLDVTPSSLYIDERYEVRRITCHAKLCYYAISPEEYLYLRAASAYTDHDSSNPLENPIIFPNSIKGGIGIFAIENPSEYSFEMVNGSQS